MSHNTEQKGFPAFLIILRLIGWGLRECGSGCEGFTPHHSLSDGPCTPLKGPLIRPVVRGDKKGTGPDRCGRS